jgi:membrane-associated phospholipid phosphatase
VAGQVVFSAYILPFFAVALAQLVLLGLIRYYRRGAPVYLMIWALPTIAVAVYLYYQFKSWSPLVNPREYDSVYQRIDDWLWPLRDGIIAARSWLDAHTSVNLDPVYYVAFALMFLAALIVYGAAGTAAQQQRLLVCICAALLIGGVSYWVAPAVGPFVYRSFAGEGLVHVQQTMLEMYRSVRASGSLPPGYFAASLGAMPSMHFGFAILFLVFAYRTRSWLVWWYWATIAWFLVDSVYLGWHYLIDIVGGAAVAAAAYWVAERFVPDRGKTGQR